MSEDPLKEAARKLIATAPHCEVDHCWKLASFRNLDQDVVALEDLCVNHKECAESLGEERFERIESISHVLRVASAYGIEVLT